MSIPKAKVAPQLGPKRQMPTAATAPTAPSVSSSFKEPDADRSKLTVNIDAELHRRFKAAVAGSGKKMRDVVEEMIEQWTDANTKRN